MLGGLVDRSIKPQQTKGFSEKEDIPAYCLPVPEYLDLILERAESESDDGASSTSCQSVQEVCALPESDLGGRGTSRTLSILQSFDCLL